MSTRTTRDCRNKIDLNGRLYRYHVYVLTFVYLMCRLVGLVSPRDSFNRQYLQEMGVADRASYHNGTMQGNYF